MLPVASPKQSTLTCEVAKVVFIAGCVIVALIVSVHPFASVTTTLYVPAAKFCGSCTVDPFDHKYAYGAVPPVGLKSIDPVLFPKHNTSTWVVDNTIGACGSVIVTLVVATHPFASVVVTV